MHTHIAGNNIDLSEDIVSAIEQKAIRLARYNPDATHCRIRLERGAGNNEARINVPLPGKVLQVTAVAGSIDRALDRAMAKMRKSLKKEGRKRKEALWLAWAVPAMASMTEEKPFSASILGTTGAQPRPTTP